MNSGERGESPMGALLAALPAATEAVEDDRSTPVRCLGCGRPLRSESGQLSHTGGRCRARRARAARLAGSLGWDSAAQLLLDGGMVRLRTHGGRAWAVTSSDGSRTYLCTARGCNCPAGLIGRYRCYHQKAVEAWDACAGLTVVRPGPGWFSCDSAVA